MSLIRPVDAPDGSRPAIFGEVLFDCFPDGSRVLGGAPFNVAWHLQALGARPVLISSVGADGMGGEIRATMARWGLSTLGLQLDAEHATGEVQVSLQDGHPSFDIVHDRAYDHIRAELLPVVEFSLVYHGSLALRQHRSRAALDVLVDACGAPVFLDVNLRAPWWSASALAGRLDRARWVKLNHDELVLLTGARGDAAELAMRLMERHALEIVVVTLGEQGAVLVARGGERLESPPVHVTDVVDTVGAGDAFAAVLILGLLQRWPLESTMGRAQQFASLVVGQRGATAENAPLYQALIDDWALAKT